MLLQRRDAKCTENRKAFAKLSVLCAFALKQMQPVLSKTLFLAEIEFYLWKKLYRMCP